MGDYNQQIKDLCDKIEDVREELGNKIESHFDAVVEEMERLFDEHRKEMRVAYQGHTTIAGLLDAGGYDYKNSDIIDKHFPQEKREPEDVEIELVHFNRSISTENALTELDQKGLRPANAAELLAFGAANPEVQRQFPIIALGQIWRRLRGHRLVVYLGGSGHGRDADLRWFDRGWFDYCRFSAVRK